MPDDPHAGGVRRFYRRYRTSVLSFLLFIAYAGAVFWSNYHSLQQIQNDALLQFQLETEKQSAAIAYYFSERRNDIDELSGSEPIVNFFRNRDLGMSFAYGLGVNVDLIEDRLERLAGRKRVGEQPIYSSLLLIDSRGTPIAGWNNDDTLKADSDWLAPENRGVRVLLAEHNRGLVISAPVRIDNAYRGELLAWTSASTSLAQFGGARESGPNWLSFLVDKQTGKPLDPEVSALLRHSRLHGALTERLPRAGSSIVTLVDDSGNQLALAQVEIAQTPLSFASVANEFPAERGSARLFLIAVGVLPFIVLLVAVLDIIERRRLEIAQEAARAEAERLAQTRSTFLANMSHEIRTPMNAIIGLSDLCLASTPGELGPRQRNQLSKIQSASNSLLHIVNDVLDFSKIESGRVDIERIPFELDSLLDDLGALLAERAREKALELCLAVDDSACQGYVGDPMRLRQVLVNLVSNAIKFSDRGTIQVRVRAESIDAEQSTEAAQAREPIAASTVRLHFSVIDEGIGLSEEQQGRLFTAFTQADTTTTRRYGGTGLGLAICKRLVELMGGRIEVGSRLGKGSDFGFFVEVDSDPGRASGVVRMRQLLAPHAACPVLVVADNPVCRTTIAAQLRQIGLSAETCCGCDEAIAALEHLPVPNCLALLLDSTMAEMKQDGAALIERLRSHLGRGPMPPVVVLASSDFDPANDAFEGRCDAIIAKPTSASRLFAGLAPLLGIEARPGQLPEYLRMPASTSGSESIDLGALDVLVVDDVPLNHEVLGDMLESAGLRVRVANNGLEALDAIERQLPDCVLMDCQMPVMDGYEATRKLRANPRYRQLVIIALTANAMPLERERCLAAGMDDYLIKPIRARELLAAIKSVTQARLPARRNERSAHTPVAATTSGAVTCPVALPELPELPGIDPQAGLQYANGKPALYCKLLHVFGESHGRDFESGFRGALRDSDWHTAIRLSHSLKTSARMIGANALADLASELEEACRANQHDNVGGLLARLLPELAKVCGGLAVVGSD